MKRTMMTIAILPFVLVIALARGGFGAVIVIPDNFPTIQAGIDAAVNGDTVLVRDGTYPLTAAIDFKGKAITVKSEHGAGNCILDGQHATRVVYFHSDEGSNSILSGFTIRNGYSGQGAGIYLSASSPTISHCTIRDNQAETGDSSCAGGGIYGSASSPVISSCTIKGNVATSTIASSGGGIYISGGHPVITNTIITANSAYGQFGASGGGISVNGSSPIIDNSDIDSNSVSNFGNYGTAGGGIYFSSTAYLSLVNCVINGNSANKGGGIYIDGSPSFPGMTNCTIVRNTATTENGGGVFFANNSTDIINSILWENSPENVYKYGTSTPNITYSDVGGGYAGTGNIDASPAFVNIALADFHLTAASPCINKGSNAAANLPSFDKDGRVRINGSSVDMGAYEYYYEYKAAEVSVFRPDNGTWYTLLSRSPLVYSYKQWGAPGDIPVPGDYDGDGKIDYAVWRPSTGVWWVLPSATPGTYSATRWGISTDKPVPGDYDFDGKTDIAVWRPGNGVWYVLPSGSPPGTYTATAWGMDGDVPIPPLTGITWPVP